MLVLVHDSTYLIDVVLHQGERLSSADVAIVEAACRRAAAAIALAPHRTSIVLALLETDHGPDAAQRQRLARAMRSVPRCLEVVVTESFVARVTMTAIRCLAPATEGRRLAAFATYTQALPFLVQETGIPPTVFDTLVMEARERIRRSG